MSCCPHDELGREKGNHWAQHKTNLLRTLTGSSGQP
nr:MAG TPA: hypothetical protein [Caudoviricetes sp.]